MKDIGTCFMLYDEITTQHDLEPQEKDYLAVLRVCAALNDQRYLIVLDTFMEHLLLSSRFFFLIFIILYMLCYNSNFILLLLYSLCKCCSQGWAVFHAWFSTHGYCVGLAQPNSKGDLLVDWPPVSMNSATSSSALASSSSHPISQTLQFHFDESVPDVWWDKGRCYKVSKTEDDGEVKGGQTYLKLRSIDLDEVQRSHALLKLYDSQVICITLAA